ncbi:rhomboid family intramembrane serine protease [Paenibacillaceae bacterium]|nr:rhomboid family intramembrane serine protease [Paenibacillaceae bacterium]
MVFLRYESFRSYLRLYPVTSVLLAINLIMFLLTEFMGGSTDNETLYRFGAFSQWIGDPYGFEEPWRYITSQFLHIGWQHLLFNCFSLLVFAPPLERLLGKVKYLLLYLVCGIGGNLLSAYVTASKWSEGTMPIIHLSAGASGAIYGVFGAYLYLALLRKHTLDDASRKTVFTILIIGLIYSILMPSINIMAHIGGCFTGFMLHGLLARRKFK